MCACYAPVAHPSQSADPSFDKKRHHTLIMQQLTDISASAVKTFLCRSPGHTFAAQSAAPAQDVEAIKAEIALLKQTDAALNASLASAAACS